MRTALDIQTALNEPGHLPVIGFFPLVDRRSNEDIEYGYHGDTLCGAEHNRAVLEEDLSRVSYPLPLTLCKLNLQLLL